MMYLWVNRVIFVWLVGFTIMAYGCGTGYGIHRSNGMETLYHKGTDGEKRIIYVVHKNGDLKIHDKNDPLIQDFFSSRIIDDIAEGQNDSLLTADGSARQKKLLTQKLVRIGRIKAAKKRGKADPIHVWVHETELGPLLSRSIGSEEKTKFRIKKLVTEEINADPIIKIAATPADVEIKLKSYFKETQALNIKTHKRVSVKAFHFEAHVQSNYLSEDCKTITGLGHWMEYQKVIQETICRVNQYIKERIGSNIPKDRDFILGIDFSKSTKLNDHLALLAVRRPSTPYRPEHHRSE